MDNPTQTPAVAETTAVTPAATTETSTPAPETKAPAVVGSETPQAVNRQELYAKLYGKGPGETAANAPPADPTIAPEVATSTNTAPVVEAAPVASVDPNADKIARLEATVTALTEAIKASAPPAKPTDPNAPATEKAWHEYFKDGELEKGQAALKKALGVPDANAVISEAVARVKAEQEISDFVSDTKRSASDVMVFEEFITLRVERELQKLVDAGKITNLPEYVKTFKEVTTKSIEEARTALQKARAAGKDEAMTVKKEVLSTSTIAPNTINKPGELSKPPEPKIESAHDYLAKRTAAQYARQGMSVSP